MSTSNDLPPCGIYKTTSEVAEIPAGRLVYFHNHGNPGPGLYLPESWKHNRAQFSSKGSTLEGPLPPDAMVPVRSEGLYRVVTEFTCCSKLCQTFAPDTLVQLGYNGHAAPILFMPQWTQDGLTVPERGTSLDPEKVEHLAPLRVAKAAANPAPADALH